jgi:DNA-binding PadR family transcriptional regulator
VSDAGRKARFYQLTRAGRKRLEKAAREWDETREIVAKFFSPGEAS